MLAWLAFEVQKGSLAFTLSPCKKVWTLLHNLTQHRSAGREGDSCGLIQQDSGKRHEASLEQQEPWLPAGIYWKPGAASNTKTDIFSFNI